MTKSATVPVMADIFNIRGELKTKHIVAKSSKQSGNEISRGRSAEEEGSYRMATGCFSL